MIGALLDFCWELRNTRKVNPNKSEFELMRHHSTIITIDKEESSGGKSLSKFKLKMVAVRKNLVPELNIKTEKRASLSREVKVAIRKRGEMSNV